MIDARVQVGRAPQASKRNALRISVAVRGVHHLGVELHAVAAGRPDPPWRPPGRRRWWR